MLIKITRGTPVQEEDALCETCRHSRVIRGRRLEDELVICGAMVVRAFRITFKVTSCTEYIDAREPSYSELFEKAWILRPPSKRRAAGFVRASDLSDDEAARLFAEHPDDGSADFGLSSSGPSTIVAQHQSHLPPLR